MAPFANWITPERAPKRFDVHFRLCWTRTEVEPVHDGREVVAAEWLRPDEAIALGDAGERVLLLPTRCQLELLGKSRTVEEAVAEARSRKISALTPQFERRPEGLFALLPADSGYPILERPIPRGGA
jgi:hypothetical protein